MSAKPKSRLPAAKDERRRELLDAARKLFAERGYHDTTVDDITRAANVAKGTFYLYFQEKREIYHAVIRGFLELIKDLGNLTREPIAHPGEFFARAQLVIRRLMDLLIENRDLARLAYRESMGLDDILSEMMSGFYREVAAVEAKNIELAVGLGLLRPCHPLLTAYIHIGMVEKTLMEMLDHPADFPPLDQVLDEMMRINYEGLKGPMAPPWEMLSSLRTPPSAS